MKYLEIAKHYEKCLEAHGPTAKGMDWPNEKDLETRFKVMLESFHNSIFPSILDLGCGAGLFLDYLIKMECTVHYTGIDISEKMISAAIKRTAIDPLLDFRVQNILKEPLKPKSFDYVIMNGVLTEKVSLSQKEMINFAKKIISASFDACKKGVAFNVMSKHVDWERKDLFHWSFDEMYSFAKTLSRHVVIRADYGLYEFTTYIYREPNR